MFKLLTIKGVQTIVNSNGDIIYTPSRAINQDSRYNFKRLVKALNVRGFRDLEIILAFENHRLL